MAQENPTWGQARVAAELSVKLGIYVSPRTVRAYWPPEPERRGNGRTSSQNWRTFVRNHAQSIVACDFLVVVTARFRTLYVFLLMTRDRVRLNNQLESLLEDAHIKLPSFVSDLMGASARRTLKALADGETNPAALAALADRKLRATPEQLCDALGACTELKPVYRRLLKMALEQLQFLEQQIDQLNQELASLLRQYQDAVQRPAEVPGLGVDSAQQIIAEVGPAAATFPSEKCLSSWVGACGDEESAGVNYNHRSPQGNRHMRRLLNQAANSAAKTKGSIFEIVYRRAVPRLGHN